MTRDSASARVTLKAINDELKRLGYDVHLDKGDGYFYFWCGEANDWLDKTVNVSTLSSLTIEQWVEAFKRLEKLNHDILRARPKVPKPNLTPSGHVRRADHKYRAIGKSTSSPTLDKIIRTTMPLSAGTRLGPYEILAQIGAGGMGIVYKARDTRVGREVALKILPAEMAIESGTRKRFKREARAASALNYPNIVSVYDVGTEGDTPYIVAVQIADGLAAAHIQ